VDRNAELIQRSAFSIFLLLRNETDAASFLISDFRISLPAPHPPVAKPLAHKLKIKSSCRDNALFCFLAPFCRFSPPMRVSLGAPRTPGDPC
jgi:hypothetical protein